MTSEWASRSSAAFASAQTRRSKSRAQQHSTRLNEIEGVSTTKPEGAFYIFPKIEDIATGKRWHSDMEFVIQLLKETGVLIVNGSGFDPVYGKDHVRIVFLPPIEELEQAFPDAFTAAAADIRDFAAVRKVFEAAGEIDLVVHTAAQPSHDWAAREPFTDFGVNAQGTLNLLEATRQLAPQATFIFTSTNKVYGDTPNRLPLEEQATRWECVGGPYAEKGIDETMSIDQTTHSLFGASRWRRTCWCRSTGGILA